MSYKNCSCSCLLSQVKRQTMHSNYICHNSWPALWRMLHPLLNVLFTTFYLNINGSWNILSLSLRFLASKNFRLIIPHDILKNVGVFRCVRNNKSVFLHYSYNSDSNSRRYYSAKFYQLNNSHSSPWLIGALFLKIQLVCLTLQKFFYITITWVYIAVARTKFIWFSTTKAKINTKETLPRFIT